MIDQNFLIILVGLPASGKSTFAYKLKEKLESNFQNKVKYKYKKKRGIMEEWKDGIEGIRELCCSEAVLKELRVSGYVLRVYPLEP